MPRSAIVAASPLSSFLPQRGRLRKQEVFGVDEATTRLPEALRRFPLPEPVHVQSLLADAGCKPGEIAVGRDEAEPVKSPAVQEIHGIDHQGDVGRVLACRIGELLLGDDGVLRQDIGPRLQARAEKSP